MRTVKVKPVQQVTIPMKVEKKPDAKFIQIENDIFNGNHADAKAAIKKLSKLDLLKFLYHMSNNTQVIQFKRDFYNYVYKALDAK